MRVYGVLCVRKQRYSPAIDVRAVTGFNDVTEFFTFSYKAKAISLYLPPPSCVAFDHSAIFRGDEPT